MKNWNKNLELYENLIELFSEVERKGKTMPYTSMNGHMFSFLDKEGILGLRLSEEDRDLFIKEHKSELMVQHGRTMKEYVIVPQSLLSAPKKLSKYFKQSYTYVASLKPKPSKKK